MLSTSPKVGRLFHFQKVLVLRRHVSMSAVHLKGSHGAYAQHRVHVPPYETSFPILFQQTNADWFRPKTLLKKPEQLRESLQKNDTHRDENLILQQERVYRILLKALDDIFEDVQRRFSNKLTILDAERATFDRDFDAYYEEYCEVYAQLGRLRRDDWDREFFKTGKVNLLHARGKFNIAGFLELGVRDWVRYNKTGFDCDHNIEEVLRFISKMPLFDSCVKEGLTYRAWGVSKEDVLNAAAVVLPHYKGKVIEWSPNYLKIPWHENIAIPLACQAYFAFFNDPSWANSFPVDFKIV